MELHKILSWNINDLNSPQKRKRTFLYLEKQKCDLICLQETQIRLKDQCLLISSKLGTLYLSSAETKKTGITIYIKPSFDSKLLEAKDRWICAETLPNQKKTLEIVYIPQIIQPREKNSLRIFFTPEVWSPNCYFSWSLQCCFWPTTQ